MYKEKILSLLRSSRNGFLSGEELARKTGISRTMVWKHITSLRREGFSIEAVPSQGYRLTSEPDLLRHRDIASGIKTKIIGRDIHLFTTLVSTNTTAMELASKSKAEGMVVIAETQTGGRGRLGRKWISPKRNLYLSVILRPAIPTHKAPLITMAGAVAVASAIRSVCGVTAGIKWPNDILISGKKVCGLLTEMSAEQDRIRHIVLGIGVDVNMMPDELPPDVRALTTTLSDATGSTVNRTVLLRQLLRDLDHWYRKFLVQDADVLAEWKKLNVTFGRRITVSGTGELFEGIAQGIDEDGRLIVRQDNGALRMIAAGDVTILKK